MEGAVVFAVLCLVAAASAQHSPVSAVTYDERYTDALKAYTQQRWSECAVYFHQAMDEYSREVRGRRKCYEACQAEDAQDSPVDAEVGFLQTVVRRASCIERCKEDFVGVRPAGGVPSYIEKHMDKWEAYNYLQMALYQDKRVREAAKACFTYSYHNPRNTHVVTNMNYYKSQPSVTEEDMEPLEPQKYRDLYREGQYHYVKKEWSVMVDKFEESLLEFYLVLGECQRLCERPLRYTQSLHFPQAVTHQLIAVMECRINCVEKLGIFRDFTDEDFFGSYFHYLQLGYYHLNRTLDAIQASATHVRLEPHSEAAKRNAVFYRQQPGVTRNNFHPLKDVLPHIEQLEAEHAFLHLIDDISGHMAKGERGDQTDSGSEYSDDEKLLEQDFLSYPIGSHQPAAASAEESVKPIVSMRGVADLQGEGRLVVDHLLSPRQCQLLIDLASHAKEGDGYNRKSPHTHAEKFEGLNILDSAKAVVSGDIPRSLTELYMNASKLVKNTVAKEFGLNSTLYFSFTHLVCRTAKEGLQGARTDHSHPVHSDNCVLSEMTGECHKIPPAYTWRDYSALLYLNDDFEGGKFFFAHSPKDLSPQTYVTSKCGRMVGFSAGEENMHGVTAVTSGRRCAVALWFTLDPAYHENSFELAEDILAGITH